MDNAERIRELLNFSGYPFQHYCAHKIARLSGFQVSAEFPFTYPPTNGPLIGLHGAIDMLAAHPDTSGELLICFVVECKKANDKVKNWILLPNAQQDPKWPTFFFTKESETQGLSLGATRSVTFPGLGYGQTSDFDFCINGIEANTDLSKTNLDKGEKVYNPLKQVAHGTRAFETTFPKIVEGIDYLRGIQFPEFFYIPVVITTANLYVPSFPIQNVSQGEIPSGELTIKEQRKWVSVEFALPDYLSQRFEREGGMSVAVPKRTVFIVNDKAIDEFFTGSLEVATRAERRTK